MNPNEQKTYPTEWKLGYDGQQHYVWRQTRELEPHEPMNSSVRERARGATFGTREECESYCNTLNALPTYCEDALAHAHSGGCQGCALSSYNHDCKGVVNGQ
jgi:hypothetical protein